MFSKGEVLMNIGHIVVDPTLSKEANNALVMALISVGYALNIYPPGQVEVDFAQLQSNLVHAWEEGTASGGFLDQNGIVKSLTSNNWITLPDNADPELLADPQIFTVVTNVAAAFSSREDIAVLSDSQFPSKLTNCLENLMSHYDFLA